ncbi:MAG: hypothetical protein M0026_07900 [Nocardiopsaceae bacterium]|nr:hypothetical protein [Nocardiopsaceae bacterium]
MTDKPFDQMTEEERSEYYYNNPDTIAEDFDWDNPVESVPAKNMGVNTSVRFSMEEHRALRDAADQAGMNISEWIRMACAAAVERANDPVQQELSETIDRARADLERARKLMRKAAKSAAKDTAAAKAERAPRQERKPQQKAAAKKSGGRTRKAEKISQ